MQVVRARKAARLDDSSEQPADTELKRSEADEPIKLSLAARAAAAAAAVADKQQSRVAQTAAPPLFGDDDGECSHMERGGDSGVGAGRSGQQLHQSSPLLLGHISSDSYAEW